MLHYFHHVLIQVTNYDEQIDLQVFKVITAACVDIIGTFLTASCVDIIVNKRLNKYN